ncbi:MAG: Omp85 family outer membrane protein [Myxococcales bacterium]|jgi:outer membrane protein assembly factor BamA
MLPALLALAVAAAGGVSAREAPVLEREAERSVDTLVVPLASFNSDDKLGFGLAGGAYVYGGGRRPYAHAFAGQVFMTTGGVQSHFLRYDGPQFLGSGVRLEGRLDYRREKFAPYFGPGNNSAPDFEGEERSGLYTYERLNAGGWVRVRIGTPGAVPQPYVGYSFRFTSVRPHEGSLLEQQRPLGVEGGRTGQVLVGIVRDTRDDESDPSRGGSQELALRIGSRATGSDYDYGQATLTVRHFVPLGRWLVLGGRVAGDWLFGDVPFYEWPNLGGLLGAEGIGGISSVRGIARHRYTGTLKLLANVELRATLAEPRILGRRIKVGGVLFADAGRAWFEESYDGPWYRLHTAGGVGVRLVHGAAVARFDFGISRDRQAVYFMLGHMF